MYCIQIYFVYLTSPLIIEEYYSILDEIAEKYDKLYFKSKVMKGGGTYLYKESVKTTTNSLKAEKIQKESYKL